LETSIDRVFQGQPRRGKMEKHGELGKVDSRTRFEKEEMD